MKNNYPEVKHFRNLIDNENLDKKRCNTCFKIYPLIDKYFGSNIKMESGRSQTCKKCSKIRFKNNYLKHKPEISKRHREEPKYIFRHIRNGALKRNIKFNIDYDFYYDKLFKKPCHYCGLETKGWLDRYDNNKNIGYTNLNSVPCCEMCNIMKLDNTVKDFLDHVKKIYKHKIQY